MRHDSPSTTGRIRKLKPIKCGGPGNNGCGVRLRTFRQTMILIPTQIIRSARRLIFRLLAWSSSLETLFRLQDSLNLPLTT